MRHWFACDADEPGLGRIRAGRRSSRPPRGVPGSSSLAGGAGRFPATVGALSGGLVAATLAPGSPCSRLVPVAGGGVTGPAGGGFGAGAFGLQPDGLAARLPSDSGAGEHLRGDGFLDSWSLRLRVRRLALAVLALGLPARGCRRRSARILIASAFEGSLDGLGGLLRAPAASVDPCAAGRCPCSPSPPPLARPRTPWHLEPPAHLTQCIVPERTLIQASKFIRPNGGLVARDIVAGTCDTYVAHVLVRRCSCASPCSYLRGLAASALGLSALPFFNPSEVSILQSRTQPVLLAPV